MSEEKKKGSYVHPTRIFKQPEELQKAFEDYKVWAKEQSKEWVKVMYVGKDGDRVEEPQKVPLSLEGFEVYCYDRYGCIGQYFDNKDKYYNDFVAVCSRIKREIRYNQITGGLLGFYNTSITQRLNGLVEKTDNTNKNQNFNTDVPLDLSGIDTETLIALRDGKSKPNTEENTNGSDQGTGEA